MDIARVSIHASYPDNHESDHLKPARLGFVWKGHSNYLKISTDLLRSSYLMHSSVPKETERFSFGPYQFACMKLDICTVRLLNEIERDVCYHSSGDFLEWTPSTGCHYTKEKE